jgi:hypothetical protein
MRRRCYNQTRRGAQAAHWPLKGTTRSSCFQSNYTYRSGPPAPRPPQGGSIGRLPRRIQALPCLDSPRRFRREIASASRRPNTQTTGITVLRPGLHRITAPQRAMSRRAAGASSPGTRPGVIADSGLACYTAAPSRIEELRRGGSRRENPVRNLSC